MCTLTLPLTLTHTSDATQEKILEAWKGSVSSEAVLKEALAQVNKDSSASLEAATSEASSALSGELKDAYYKLVRARNTLEMYQNLKSKTHGTGSALSVWRKFLHLLTMDGHASMLETCTDEVLDKLNKLNEPPDSDAFLESKEYMKPWARMITPNEMKRYFNVRVLGSNLCD